MNNGSFVIKTGLDKEFTKNILSRDITTQACIFDLIDNSIDAAKRELNGKNDYEGFEVKIFICDDCFSIEDNCGGFQEKDLLEKAFIIGKQSSHKHGLGKYGVGMKRAILKMGNEFRLLTDNQKACFELRSKVDNLSSSNDQITANRTDGKSKKTLLSVKKLTQETLNEFKNTKWRTALVKGIETRYGLFLGKGFSLSVKFQNSAEKSLKSKLPQIRDSETVPILIEEAKIDGVNIEIKAGLHEQYVITSKQGLNRRLTQDFGWYIICNERVVEVSVKSGEGYGWSGAWHSEYGGFVGYVNMSSENPDNLPWNTSKTQVDTNSKVMLHLRDDLTRISSSYKANRKNAPKEDIGKARKIDPDHVGHDSPPAEIETRPFINDSHTNNGFDNKNLPLKSMAQVLGVKKNVGTKAYIIFEEIQAISRCRTENQGYKVSRAALIRALIETSLKFYALKFGKYDETEEEKRGIKSAPIGRIIENIKQVLKERKERINDYSSLLDSVRALDALVRDLNGMIHKDGIFMIDDSERKSLESIKFIVEGLSKIENSKTSKNR